MLGHLLLAIGVCLPVQGDRILMRDLASALPAFAGRDDQEPIGLAPAAGAVRRFSAGELIRLAARKGIGAAVEPVCFERKRQPLTKDQVLASLRRSLPQDATLELLGFSDSPVPEGVIDFPRNGLSAPNPAAPRGPVIWKGRVTYATAQSVPTWAKVRVWVTRPIVVASEDLPAGRAIESGKIRIAEREFPPFTEPRPAAVETFLGTTPRRTIRADAPLSVADLDAPVDITRGGMVGVEARVGAASIKFKVRAEASGRVGDLVPVRNVESGKTFRARVIRKGWVAVE